MKLQRYACLGAIAVVMAATVACGDDESASGSETINIGFFPVVSPVPFIQDDAEFNENHDVNWVPVEQGLPGAASALAAGRLDAVYANSFSATIIFSESPEAAQFIGQSFVNANVTVVRTDSDIEDIEDITDRKVVVSGDKTASTIYFEIGLEQAGVDPDSNEYFTAGTGPGMMGVLDSGDAEVAAGYVPYTADMVLRDIGEVIFDADDAIGAPAPGDGFIARKAWVEENEAAAEDLVRAQFRATDHISEGSDDAYARMAEFADASEESVKHSFESEMISVAPTYVPDVDGIVTATRLAEQLGFAEEGVDDLPGFAEEFFNTSLAEKVEGEQ